MVARAFCGLLLTLSAARTLAQAPALTPGLARETVDGIARLIEAEYMDAATGARLAAVLRRRLAFQVMIPNGQVRSAVSGGNWENRGVTPDVKVAAADALAQAHARAQQRISRAAVF